MALSMKGRAKGALVEESDALHIRNNSSGRKGNSDHRKHGTWKLVYADFVTVLVAFFMVVWVQLWDKVSKIPEIDMRCIEKMAQDLRADYSGGSVDRQRKRSPLEIDLRPDGLRLTLIDTEKPMFESGQAVLSGFAKTQFSRIAEAVNGCPSNKLKIEGYTDANPFGGGGQNYTNWELSSDRANAARRELLANKVKELRISQVIGYGDSVPALIDDPKNSLNRRISITILPVGDVLPRAGLNLNR